MSMQILSFDNFNKNKKKEKKPKLKLKKTNIVRFSVSLAVIFFCIFSLLFLTNKKLYENDFSHLYNSYNSVNIIELWHIDSFEGGSINRADFLQSSAIEFNKKNRGQYITIKSLTIEQAALNIDSGYLPDAVSFGLSAGELFKGRILPLNIKNEIRDDLINYGRIDNVQYALPYMLGGYAAISHENLLSRVLNGGDFNLQDIYKYNAASGKRKIPAVGFATNTCVNVANAQLINNISCDNTENLFSESLTQYEAYERFLSGSFVSLIGTQRDVIRCKNREEKGSLSTCVYNYLAGFSDLVQYFAVLDNGKNSKVNLAEKFIEYMLDPEVQKTITRTGMFSVVERAIYTDGYLKDFERAMLKPLTSVNVFESAQKLIVNNQKSLEELIV